MTTETQSKESQSGLAPWNEAALPAPPRMHRLNILAVVGPGVILLGVSIGSGEWLLGPAAFIQYGLSLLWVTTIAVGLQVVLNTELIRYTLYTGEPALTGFLRTRPNAGFWSGFYALLWFLQVGWPGWAGAAASAIYFLFFGQLAGERNEQTVYLIGVATFLVCVITLLISQHIERTLEVFNWILLFFIFSGLLILGIMFVSPQTWLAGAVGFVGFDVQSNSFVLLPEGADWQLIAAFAAYSGAGGVVNLMVSNWTRDKGYGMGKITGYIPAAASGAHPRLAHVGSIFTITPENLAKWRGWWRIVQIDQYLIFFLGALVGMGLPAVLYVSFVDGETAVPGLSVMAELGTAMAARGGVAFTFMAALLGAWILFKTQLVILEGTVRAIADLLWSSSHRIRHWRGGDVRAIYYTVLAIAVVWGMVALRISQPIILLQVGANMAGVVLVISSIHILYVNTTFLPPELQPPLWRRVALIATALFYGSFVYLWLMGGLLPNPDTGFLFNIPQYFSGR